jgi:hypothetical protein
MGEALRPESGDAMKHYVERGGYILLNRCSLCCASSLPHPPNLAQSLMTVVGTSV